MPTSVVRCQWLISTCSCAEQQAHHGEAEESADQPLSERAEGSHPGRDEEGRKLHNYGTVYSSDSIYEYVVRASKQNSSKTALKIHDAVPSVGNHIEEKSRVFTDSSYITILITVVSVFRN